MYGDGILQCNAMHYNALQLAVLYYCSTLCFSVQYRKSSALHFSLYCIELYCIVVGILYCRVNRRIMLYQTAMPMSLQPCTCQVAGENARE